MILNSHSLLKQILKSYKKRKKLINDFFLKIDIKCIGTVIIEKRKTNWIYE